MKKLLIGLAALALIAGVAPKAEADNPATITVTVTLEGLSVSVDLTTWTETDVALSGTASKAFVVTNNSTAYTEDLGIKCSNGLDAHWTIGPSIGADVFKMTANTVALNAATDVALATGVLVDGTVALTLEFTAPSSTTRASDRMTVTITAS